MKFNAFIVELKHRDTSFTSGLVILDQIISANFRKIGIDLFIANFKTQVEFHFLERVKFKNMEKEIVVLLPAISKYNKRKLTKISKFLGNDNGQREKTTLLLKLLTVEKFLKAQELLSFFNINREEAIDFLIGQEIREKIKIIDFTHLYITPYDNVQDYHQQLNQVLTDGYTGTSKTMKLSMIESKLKLPQSSLFFKYLLRCARSNFSFNISQDTIVFQKVALSESEKISLEEIEKTLQQNKLIIFTIEDIVKNSELPHDEINRSLWLSIERNQVVRLNERFFILTDELNKIVNKLKKYKRNRGDMIDIATFRELITLSRKYILALFEYFDTQGITQRVENQRQIIMHV